MGMFYWESNMTRNRISKFSQIVMTHLNQTTAESGSIQEALLSFNHPNGFVYRDNKQACCLISLEFFHLSFRLSWFHCCWNRCPRRRFGR